MPHTDFRQDEWATKVVRAFDEADGRDDADCTRCLEDRDAILTFVKANNSEYAQVYLDFYLSDARRLFNWGRVLVVWRRRLPHR